MFRHIFKVKSRTLSKGRYTCRPWVWQMKETWGIFLDLLNFFNLLKKSSTKQALPETEWLKPESTSCPVKIEHAAKFLKCRMQSWLPLLVLTTFALPIKMPPPLSFPSFSFLILWFSHLPGECVSGCLGLSCLMGLAYNSMLYTIKEIPGEVNALAPGIRQILM